MYKLKCNSCCEKIISLPGRQFNKQIKKPREIPGFSTYCTTFYQNTNVDSLQMLINTVFFLSKTARQRLFFPAGCLILFFCISSLINCPVVFSFDQRILHYCISVSIILPIILPKIRPIIAVFNPICFSVKLSCCHSVIIFT